VCQDCRSNAIDMTTAGSTATPTPRPRAVVSKYPPVTTALVGINAAVFVMMLFSGVPLENPTIAQLLKWGADWGPLSLREQPWRILTSNYLHIGIIHIGLNMWCLWNLGSLAERIFDRWTYVLTYTACGIAGSLGSLWWHPMVVGAGASGAIFGLAGALIMALYLGKLPIPKEATRGTMKSLVAFAGYNLLFGAVGASIDNSAHIGGLLTGLALGTVLAKHLTDSPEIRTRWNWGVFIFTAAVIFMFFNFVRHANGSLPSLPAAGVNQLRSPTTARAINFDDRAWLGYRAHLCMSEQSWL
jgi:rhomboid protease GluP